MISGKVFLVYLPILLEIGYLSGFYVSSSCPLITEQARQPCGYTGIRSEDCNTDGCCWDEDAQDIKLKCYQKECRPGFFGWRCGFQCQCQEGDTCDRYTGECHQSCPEGRWGVGCMLDNSCTYNDNTGEAYLGHQVGTENGHTCGNWSYQRAYPGEQFPDGNLKDAQNFCRNPKPVDYMTWCYYKFGSNRKWDYCQLYKCDCMKGRWGVNCDKECHCNDHEELCGQSTGSCSSGCDPRWQGRGCQECSEGYFGPLCEERCHCHTPTDICHRQTGQCQSGCAAGWTGHDCQTECADGRFGFSCEFECNCKDKLEVCSKANGRCVSGCTTGFSGDGCQIHCHCRNPLEICDPVDGSCHSGCALGWVGPACDIEIPQLTKPPIKTARGSTSVSLRWRRFRKPRDKGDGPVTSYLIYYALAQEGANPEWKSVRPSSTLSGTINGLQPDTTYQFMTMPIHESGVVGLGSPTINVSTCGAPLSGPLGVTLEEVDQEETDGGRMNNIKLAASWKNLSVADSNCDRIKAFKVYLMAPQESTFEFLGQESGMTRIIQNIDPFYNYTVGVSAVNNADLESEMTEAMYIGKSGPVQHLRIQPLTSTSLRVIWEPPQRSNAPVLFYVLRYKEVRVGNCEVDAAQWSPMIDTDADVYQQQLLDLVPYTKYDVMVWGETRAGMGQDAVETAVTEPTAPSGKVEGIQCTDKQTRTASFKWEPPECDTRHGEFVGFRYELRNKDSLGKLEAHSVLNATEVVLQNLVPYTAYVFQVWFINHVADGPKSDPLEFTTLEDKPPAPEGFTIAVRTHHSLTVRWGPPNPPHGIIKGYELKYWSSQTVSHPGKEELAPHVMEFNITELKPNASYGVQVRASTAVGQGDWSQTLFGFTDESLPDEPTNLNNISRSTDSLTLQWDDPVKPNGLLKDFNILCSPMSPLGQYKTPGAEGHVEAGIHQYTVKGLHPGTAYVCTVKASTRKGYGPHTRKIFYTMPQDPLPPELPEFDETKTTDNSVTLVLHPNELEPSNTEVSDSIYQIVLEMLSGTQQSRFKRGYDETTPCGLSPGDLVDYKEARRRGQGCYITAEIGNVDKETQFVVGDNRTYGEYYNAPLQKGQSYDVWVGLVVTVDGVTAASYSKSKTPALAAQYIEPEEDGMQMAMMAGAGVGIVLALLLLILVIAILVVRKKRSKSKPTALERTESDKFESSRMDTDRDCDRVLFSPDRYSAASLEEEQDIAETDPLYCNTGINLTRDPISVENLWNFVKEKKSSTTEGFRQEYDELPQGLVAKCEESRKPENKLKNRYGNIIAYDHSRAKLKRAEGDFDSDYINANYVDAYRRPSAYIATQGPSKHTLNDIWLLAWLENSTRIVMVTNLVEDGRHKCEQYWPDSDSATYGDMKVELMDVEEFADFKIRTFTCKSGDSKKTVRQFHFTAWPDHGVPTYATSLLAFRKKVRFFDDPTAGPTIVHCSAGVGRTGTFIALDYLLDQAKVEGQVDVHSCVQQMRTKRVNMVQTQEQYVFVYDALLEALKSGDTSIPCVEFRQRYADLCGINEETGKMKLQEEFELLGVMSPPTNVTNCKDALDPENVDKNRNKEIIPIDNMSRPYLFTYAPGATDYINAVFVDGYKQRDAFILTQHPMASTVVDFWTLVYDHDCKTIIMMNEVDDTDKDCAEYFSPQKAGSMIHEPFTVETVSVNSTHEDVTVRDLSIKCNKRDSETRSVRHFSYHGWPKGQCLPISRSSIIVLLQLVEKWQQRSGNAAIAVHCLDGATQSGMFGAISYMVERLKVEQEVDVFQSVKHTRVNRPQLVPTMQQYQFLYDMAVEYMDCFETYANFK